MVLPLSRMSKTPKIMCKMKIHFENFNTTMTTKANSSAHRIVNFQFQEVRSKFIEFIAVIIELGRACWMNLQI